MKCYAVFGFVLEDKEYIDYADKHQLAVGLPLGRRFKAVKSHWLERLNAVDLAFVRYSVRPSIDSENLAECIILGTNEKGKWVTAWRKGLVRDMIERAKRALDTEVEPQWYNVAKV